MASEPTNPEPRPHVLVIAWCFPPFTGGGVYRPLNFVRHLHARGYRITVLTGKFAAHHPQDPSLLERVPDGVRVIRCRHHDPFRWYASLKRALGRGDTDSTAASPPAPSSNGGPTRPARAGAKDRLSESMATPDKWRSWIFPASFKAGASMRRDPPDLIFATAPPHSVLLIAQRLARRFGCPLAIDFRDPWVGNPFKSYCCEELERKDQELEARVVRDAACVIANTPALERRLRERYPDLDHFKTITNGFDPEQFPAIVDPPLSERLEVVHVGHLYGLRSGKYLVQGLRRLKELDRPAFDALDVQLIGRVDGEDELKAALAEHGVEAALQLVGPCPHHEALARQRAAQALLILGIESEGPEVQVPSKLYEYFAAGRGIITLSRRGGAIEELLLQSRVPFARAEPDDPEEIARAFADLYRRWREGKLKITEPEATRAFAYDRLTDRLEESLGSVLNSGQPSREPR